jgi:hypothetical protein
MVFARRNMGIARGSEWGFLSMPEREPGANLFLVSRPRDEVHDMNSYTSERFARDRFEDLRAEASGDVRVQMAEDAAASTKPAGTTARQADRAMTGWSVVAPLLAVLRTPLLAIGAGWRKATGRPG